MNLSKQIQQEVERLVAMIAEVRTPKGQVDILSNFVTQVAAEIVGLRNENAALKDRCAQCDTSNPVRTEDAAVISFIGYWEMLTPPEPMFEVRYQSEYRTSLCLRTLTKRGIALPAGFTYPTFEEWKVGRGGPA